MQKVEGSNKKSKSVLLFCIYRLLIVVTIGITTCLSLIFIFKPNVDKQKEAALYLKTIVIAQKEKYSKEGRFANSIQELNIDFLPTSNNFDYTFLLPKQKNVIDGVFIVAKANNSGDRNFIGLVYAYEENKSQWGLNNEIYTDICGAKRAGILAPEVITLPSIPKDISSENFYIYSVLNCPQNYTPIPR
jgi:hypothetical protein